MAVHIYGLPVDMDPLLDLARKHGLKVIEDAAEALGATYEGKNIGTFGDASAFSFFGNKISYLSFIKSCCGKIPYLSFTKMIKISWIN